MAINDPIAGSGNATGDILLDIGKNEEMISVEDVEERGNNTLHARHLWGFQLPAYFNKDSDRTLVRKLDIFIFSYTLLASFINNLDRTNISNAYVSGMQEDLSLYGDQLNYFSTFFNVGYIVGAVPIILLATRVRFSIIMPTCELLWSFVVMGIAGAKNAQTIYGLRFLLGFFEAISFPGFASILGAWYTPSELGKRMAMYEVSSNIAGMFSGYIQAGLYAHMDGKSGLRGWRWLFIFDGLISIPVAVWGFYALPDQPVNSKARYLTKENLLCAMDRMKRAGRKPIQEITWKRLLGILNTWHLYLFVACYTLYGAFSWGDSYFNLWLEYLNIYSVEQLNNIPTAGQGAAVVNSVFSGILSDVIGNRPIIIVLNMLLCIFANISLACWKSPTALKFVAYILITTSLPAQSLTITWASEICQGNATMRGLIVAIGNTFVYAINAWALVLLFPAVDAPHYKYGYGICAGFIALGMISVGVILYLIRLDLKTGRAYYNATGLLEYAKWQNADRGEEEFTVAETERPSETSRDAKEN